MRQTMKTTKKCSKEFLAQQQPRFPDEGALQKVSVRLTRYQLNLAKTYAEQHNLTLSDLMRESLQNTLKGFECTD